MYAVTGVTGQVGGATARALLAAGQAVRAVLRDPAKAALWEKLGASVAIADAGDAAALKRAFSGVDGAYVMVPPDFDPQPGFPGARAAIGAQVEALAAAAVPQVVALSSIGGQRSSGLGLITQSHLLEQALAGLKASIAILRPGWFMENSAWDLAPARETGAMPSFLDPLDRPYPMVATADIGKVAAQVLAQQWQGRRVIEIGGPKRYTQHEIAALLGRVLGREVQASAVPRAQWEALFRSQGMQRPAPRIEMIDGFNSGWIEFEPGVNEHLTGATGYEAVLAGLVSRQAV